MNSVINENMVMVWATSPHLMLLLVFAGLINASIHRKNRTTITPRMADCMEEVRADVRVDL